MQRLLQSFVSTSAGHSERVSPVVVLSMITMRVQGLHARGASFVLVRAVCLLKGVPLRRSASIARRIVSGVRVNETDLLL